MCKVNKSTHWFTTIRFCINCLYRFSCCLQIVNLRFTNKIWKFGVHYLLRSVLKVRFYGNTVFYPVPNRIYVRVCCDLYECLCIKYCKIFTIVPLALLLGYIMLSHLYYSFPNSTTQFRTERPKVRVARTFLIKIGHVSLMGLELIPQGLFLIKSFVSTTYYASLYMEKYELLKF